MKSFDPKLHNILNNLLSVTHRSILNVFRNEHDDKTLVRKHLINSIRFDHII